MILAAVLTVVFILAPVGLLVVSVTMLRIIHKAGK